MNSDDINRIINWQLNNLIYVDDLEDLFDSTGLWSIRQRQQFANQIDRNRRLRQRIEDHFDIDLLNDPLYIELTGREPPRPPEPEPEPDIERELEHAKRTRLTRPQHIPEDVWKDNIQKVRNRNIYITDFARETIRTLEQQGMNRTNISKELARISLIEQGIEPTNRLVNQKFRGWYDVVIDELGPARGGRRR